MTRIRLVAALATLTLVASFPDPGVASDEPGPETRKPLRVDEHRARAAEVPAWDAASPQRLARVDGALYQEQGSRYYPVVPDHITARLAEGVGDWDELVARALGDQPRTFGALADLQLVRKNRLDIVDLAVPPGTDVIHWCKLLDATGLVRYAEVATYGTYTATQSDPLYPDQWALNNTGQTGGTPGADIRAESAWDLTAGDPSIVVAIVDSGVDIDHEDLWANVWHNAGEIPDNATDDDGNGYVDDWEGWDFNGNHNDPRSTNYHGTHVAGIVNASGSNGSGIAGLAGGLGSSGVRAMALGVGEGSPNANVLDDAILYAADNGAHVITISLDVGESQAINDALDYAYNLQDVFIDCASGNSGSQVGYPATRPEAMAVGSTDHNDQASGFSNPGPEVEVAAPGSNVLSTQLADSYGSSSGTSFAAPYVAGLAALIRSRNPGLPAPEVRQMIIDSAVDVEAPGYDEKTGHGRIDAFEAVSRAADSNGTIRLDAAAYSCDDSVGVTVSDIDLAGAGAISVMVHSETETDDESLTLNEVGSGSGVFRGSIATAGAPATPDGVLQVADGDTLVARYVDADDGAGGTGVVKDRTASVDCLPPAISGVGTQNLSDTVATVVWTTDEPATSVVRYDETPPLTRQAAAVGRTTQHAVTLDGLVECTTYRFEVESEDSVSNVTVDDNGGGHFVFQTWGDFPGVGLAPCSQGQVQLDREGTYGCGDVVGVTVIDADLDTDPGAVETIEVQMTSGSEPAGEWITLTEITAENSRFASSIPLSAGPPVPGDGQLAVAPGDFITATYHDADNGQGESRVVTDTSAADCAPPQISDVRVTEVSSTRAVVEWDTDEPATSRVDFGADAGLGSVAENSAAVTAHRVTISPFDACERVLFRVSSADEHGDVQQADAGGQPLAFNLRQIGGLVFHDNFETDTGWQLPGDWERGSPQRLGSPSADPAASWSGAHVIGNDLSGQGTYPGDYEPSTGESALSPAFSTRQRRDLELIIQRKLGVTSTDEAGIYIVTGGADQIWTSNYSANDDDWLLRRFDISAFADNKSSVQIEFRLESSDPDHSFGWNIDELIVKDRTEPDYLVCGGCGGAPTFRGIAAAHDPDPCAPGGLLVRWEPAPAWGTGTTGTYDVHRGTTSTFVPDSGNRVATGLGGTSWTDAGAPVDTPVWYVVRARNDESCSGGEGLADGNLVRRGATETTSQSLPGPVGATVLARNIGAAHVRLEWTPAACADHYVVRRGTAFDGSDAVPIGTVTETRFEDIGAALDPRSLNYRVYAVDACGREE